jgi:hypothetical protein
MVKLAPGAARTMPAGEQGIVFFWLLVKKGSACSKEQSLKKQMKH